MQGEAFEGRIAPGLGSEYLMHVSPAHLLQNPKALVPASAYVKHSVYGLDLRKKIVSV